jgi:hypothetical protein
MKSENRMRVMIAIAAMLLCSLSFADSEYLGLYLQGNKIGYSEYSSGPATLHGKALTRSDSKTIMNAGLLGSALTMEMNSTSWLSADGKPTKMTFAMSSAGRTQNIVANFGPKSVEVAIDNSGTKSTKTLQIPNGAIVDDPITMITAGVMHPGDTKPFYVLDPTTVSFIRNEVKIVGPGKAEVRGKSFDATVVEITDPRAGMTVYLSAKGDLIKIDGPMGIEMLPISKAEALAAPGEYAPSIDLAYATMIKTDKPIDDPAGLKKLSLRVTAKNLKSVPSGDHQTVKRDGASWLISVHPPQLSASPGSTIDKAAAEKVAFTKPSLNIPSNAPEFKRLAASIVGKEKNVDKASLLVQRWVNKQMKPNAGIGVLRDATEIVKTKEGVCRDYAILTVTLLRAAGIPARLASGLVNWDGNFYYHAWAESWNGSKWIGIDSTTAQAQISAAHVKLGEGNVEQAFTFTLLDQAKVEVLSATKG